MDPTEDLSMDGFSHNTGWLETSDSQHIPIIRTVSFGRSSSNSFRLASASASRRHATVNNQNDGEFWLVDLGSMNGTYLNSRRIFQPVKLSDRDQIEIAGEVFLFRQTKDENSALQSISDVTVVNFRSQPYWLLLADIEGFTPLSRSVPPDQLAVIIGGWFLVCQKIIDENGGRIRKYLGDGLLANWISDDTSAIQVSDAIRQLAAIMAADPRFRFVIHHGMISTGACLLPGDEAMYGPDLNFIFRMESLAAQLRIPILFSEEAHARLSAHIPASKVSLNSLKGFEGDFSFYAPE